LAQVFDNPNAHLNPSEQWMLLVLDVAETADGFSVPVKMEIDWLTGAPWELQTIPGKDNIGVLLLSHLNSAIRKAMKELLALDVSSQAMDSAEAKSAVQSTLEKRVWKELGFADDGTIDDRWYDRIHSEDTSPLAVLARYGLLMLRARVVDVRLPNSLKEQLQKPAIARAKVSERVLEAEGSRLVAEKKKETRKLEGQGEMEYATAIAGGDKARIDAWKPKDDDDKAAIAARLQSQGLESYQAAVTASKSPIIVGTPGVQIDGASAIAGGLSQLGVGLGNRAKAEGDKGNQKGKNKDKGSSSSKETSDNEESSDE
jgi:hypothetical protein